MPKKTFGLDTNRKSKGHRRKGTYALYGKNTPKGLRIKQQKLENMQKNKMVRVNNYPFFFS